MFHQGYGCIGSMGGFPGMGFIFLITFAIIIFLIITYFKSNGKENRNNDDALEILRNRFAKGEISKEEYLSIKETLKKSK